MREGMPGVPPEMLPPIDLPIILGTDVSGVVAAVGDGIAYLKVGDEVFGLLRFPDRMQSSAYAEHVTAPAGDLARKPAELSHREAAAVPMAALTAWQFLIDVGHDHPSPFQAEQHRPVEIGPGTTVFVNGAAGGVGRLVVQLAKWRGARVIAVASGGHEAFLRDLGADEFIDYRKQRPEDVARDIDLVVDTVGGPASRRFLQVLKWGGTPFLIYLADFDPYEVARYGVTTSATQMRERPAARDDRGSAGRGHDPRRHRHRIPHREGGAGVRTRRAGPPRGQDRPRRPMTGMREALGDLLDNSDLTVQQAADRHLAPGFP